MDHVRDLVATHLPGQPVRSVTRLGEGSDHVAYQVDGLIVRFRRGPGAARDVSREADLLAEVGGISPVAVPQPAFVAPEQGCLAYRRLPGRPLLHLPRPRRAALGQQVAAVLGAELAALHTAPVARMADLVPADDTSLAEWRDEAAGRYAEVAGEIPAGYRQRVEAFLASTVPAGGWSPAFSHNDLGIEHVLVADDGTVTGLIDWSDAALVDPACDFGRLYRDLGPAALDAAIRHYQLSVAGLRERAFYYGRCMVFEDLSYGLETSQDNYVDKSLAALVWLFPG